MKKGSTESKSVNKIGRVCEENRFYLDKDSPFKRALRH